MTRVTIVQPLVRHYRIPLFDALASEHGIDLTVVSAGADPLEQGLGHLGSLPYLDDQHPWVTLPPTGALMWQRDLGHVHLGEHGDVLIVSGNLRYLSNWPLMLRARHRGLGVVWWTHGRTRQPKRAAEALRVKVMRWADAVLLYTDEEVTWYRDKVAPPEKLFATNNTIDEAPIRKAIAYWDAARLALFRADRQLGDEPLLLYCGRLKPLARVELALYALRKLHDAGLRARLVVIGDGSERETLQSLAQELGIAHKVHWTGALYDQMELAPWFLCSRAFVYPGPIGLGLMHSLHYGLPVITHSNRTNHKPEIAALQDGVNCLLFSEANVEALAAKIKLILDNLPLRDKLSRGALRTVRERYSLERMVKGFIGAVRHASASAVNRRHTRLKE